MKKKKKKKQARIVRIGIIRYLAEEYFTQVLVVGIVSSLLFGMMVQALDQAEREAAGISQTAVEAMQELNKGQVAGETDVRGPGVKETPAIQYDEQPVRSVSE